MIKKLIHNYRGACLTLAVSIILLYIFFGKVLSHPNQVGFAANGDGFLSYYNHIYHVKYDTVYFRTQGQNYPYGEMIYYTGVQLVPVSILKFIDSHLFPVSDYMIGIQNVMMLFSIVLAALFLYLIFKRLKMPEIVSAIAAVAIAFLSPQLDRLYGHFTLAYVFVVPLVLYLFLRFYEKPDWTKAIIIGLVAFWAFTTHAYYFVMLAFVWLFYWLHWLFINKNKQIKLPKAALLCIIQLILPFLIAQFFLYLYDPVADRTASPYGFLVYLARPEGILLPFGKPYGRFLYSLYKSTDFIQWEGIAYIGLAGITGTVIIFYSLIKKVFRKQFKSLADVAGNKAINIFFWMSIVALLYSFGLPFICKLQWLVDYSGPLKQMRAIGRFAWLFFYMINIATIFIIWKWADTGKKKILLWVVILVLCYDAYLNVRFIEGGINNQIPELTDVDNKLPENEWVKLIQTQKFQAIVPLPYFDIGSENIGVSPQCDNISSVLIAGLKTGLPSTGISLSRTSISQAAKNLELTLEPYRKLSIINDYPNHKSLLLAVYNCELRPGEKNLVNHSNLIYKGSKLSFYELPFNTLSHLCDSLYYKAMVEYQELKPGSIVNLKSSKDTVNYVYLNFDNLKSSSSYLGNGAFEAKCDEYATVYSGTVPNYSLARNYIVSFWFGNILKDVTLRGLVYITCTDSLGNAYQEDTYMVNNGIKAIDGNWALCEFNFRLKKPSDLVRITFRNSQLRKQFVLVDELIIRPEGINLFQKLDKGIVKNNRLYLKN